MDVAMDTDVGSWGAILKEESFFGTKVSLVISGTQTSVLAYDLRHCYKHNPTALTPFCNTPSLVRQPWAACAEQCTY